MDDDVIFYHSRSEVRYSFKVLILLSSPLISSLELLSMFLSGGFFIDRKWVTFDLKDSINLPGLLRLHAWPQKKEKQQVR